MQIALSRLNESRLQRRTALAYLGQQIPFSNQRPFLLDDVVERRPVFALQAVEAGQPILDLLQPLR
jgi:hypothetical protein